MRGAAFTGVIFFSRRCDDRSCRGRAEGAGPDLKMGAELRMRHEDVSGFRRAMPRVVRILPFLFAPMCFSGR